MGVSQPLRARCRCLEPAQRVASFPTSIGGVWYASHLVAWMVVTLPKVEPTQWECPECKTLKTVEILSTNTNTGTEPSDRDELSDLSSTLHHASRVHARLSSMQATTAQLTNQK